MTSTTLLTRQSPLPRLAAMLQERRRTASARRQHDAVLQDPRMASEHTAAAVRAESTGQGSCPFCR